MGFCLLSLERFLTLVVDSGSTPPFGKEGKNPSKGKGQKKGRTESNVSRKAKTWIPSPFVPKRLCRFYSTTTNPGHPPQNLCSSPENH